ncbi:MAG: glycerophosphodiester phosphodiesterase [Dehalococcoidia bacterium]
MTPETALHRLIAPGAARPVFIAHGGGNSRRLTHEALAAKAEYLEVDLWVHKGRLEARHERRVPLRVPALYEKWYMRFPPRDAFGLRDLVEAACPAAGLFLDLKDGGPAASRLVAEALGASPPRPVAASSQCWGLLRPLAEAAPGVMLFYSVDVQAKLDLFLSVAGRDHRPRGVSCRHSLLTPPVVAELHARGLDVVAWTVDDGARAAELAAMGVDGITTHRVAELRALVGG